MIGSVRGRVIARGADHVVVEVGGLGYKVFVPRQPDGDDVLLHTHHVVREDGQSLFGFASREELALFEMLISVSGVGPRAALALLAVSSPAQLAAAIASGDAAALARAPGVGKKTAERLIVDLRAKVGAAGAPLPEAATSEDEAAAALQALGYTPSEAVAALRGVPAAGKAPTEERVRAALLKAGRA
ncbi:MAG: Holliday junction branch migration protein RuvA [Chloroflexota bacterium]|nr:Holliday junction branch migration protein RuvA [Chloroflexota bacterium]MDE3102535.1 Holliday junction branch migration protein RuvA [Chloroflexota bacterium]